MTNFVVFHQTFEHVNMFKILDTKNKNLYFIVPDEYIILTGVIHQIIFKHICVQADHPFYVRWPDGCVSTRGDNLFLVYYTII